MRRVGMKKEIRQLLAPLRRNCLNYMGNCVSCDFSYLDEKYAVSSKSFITAGQRRGDSHVPKTIYDNIAEQKKVNHLLNSINRIPLVKGRREFIGYYLQNRSICTVAAQLFTSSETVYRRLAEAEDEFLWQV